jgi:hypothetical protein
MPISDFRPEINNVWVIRTFEGAHEFVKNRCKQACEVRGLGAELRELVDAVAKREPFSLEASRKGCRRSGSSCTQSTSASSAS